MCKRVCCQVPYDADLLLTLKETTKKLNVTNGTVNVIGALRKAVIHYYIQEQKTFLKRLGYAARNGIWHWKYCPKKQ